MGTIVTVTCERDKYQMELQALTLNKYWRSPNKHYVILQDSTNVDEWYDLLAKYYNIHNLSILTRKTNPELFSKNNLRNYVEQMLLKLNIANIIDTPYYLVLDSKNYFFDYFDNPLAMIEGSGEPVNYMDESLEWFRPFILECAKYFNKKPLEQITFPATPFVFKTVNVLTMLDHDIDNFFAYFSQYNSYVSEFIAYSYFADYYDNIEIKERGAMQFVFVIWAFHRFNISNTNSISEFRTHLKEVDQNLVEKILKHLAELEERRMQDNQSN